MTKIIHIPYILHVIFDSLNCYHLLNKWKPFTWMGTIPLSISLNDTSKIYISLYKSIYKQTSKKFQGGIFE